MTLPQSYIATLVLMILGMICWGSWANTYKMAGSWRFELFYFDYAIGFMLAAALAAFTLGTMGSDGFQFLDDIGQTGKRNIFYAFGGGVSGRGEPRRISRRRACLRFHRSHASPLPDCPVS